MGELGDVGSVDRRTVAGGLRGKSKSRVEMARGCCSRSVGRGGDWNFSRLSVSGTGSMLTGLPDRPELSLVGAASVSRAVIGREVIRRH